jgi:hypothetical protein
VRETSATYDILNWAIIFFLPDSRDPLSHPDSIFSPKSEPGWDSVFSDIKSTPPLVPSRTHLPPPLRKAGETPVVTSRVRRQTMTAREISAFDEMFSMIFDAVTEQKQASASQDGRSAEPVTIGRKTNMTDLFGKLRRHTRRLKWTSESDQLLDRKKEEMDLCDTDQQLLEWAMREVFGESKRYEAAAHRMMAEVASTGKEPESVPMLQPETYPHLIALLMRSFRDKYNDPHLALSIFDHARHLSIASYVFGCTTSAYNELMETRWRCFRDLKGVYDALDEMVVNGVDPDARTRKLTEAIRREVSEQDLWDHEDDLGGGEVLTMLGKIDKLMIKSTPPEESRDGNAGSSARQPRDTRRKWSDWKSEGLDRNPKDKWEFDSWEDLRRRSAEKTAP